MKRPKFDLNETQFVTILAFSAMGGLAARRGQPDDAPWMLGAFVGTFLFWYALAVIARWVDG